MEPASSAGEGLPKGKLGYSNASSARCSMKRAEVCSSILATEAQILPYAVACLYFWAVMISPDTPVMFQKKGCLFSLSTSDRHCLCAEWDIWEARGGTLD